MIIEFTIHVDQIRQVVALYDMLQVFRSPDQSGSPTAYASITAPSPEAAIIDGTVEGPWNLQGTSLTLAIDNGDPVTVSFTAVNPFTLQDVVATINAASVYAPALASEMPTDTNKLRLTSPITGTQSALHLSGTATTLLGLATAKTNGKGANPLLAATTEDYLFRDFDGLSAYWYKTRYFSSVTGISSDFTDPFQAGEGVALSGSALVTGKVALADLTGAPIVGRRIILVPVSPQIVSDGSGNNYGILPSVDRIMVTTDDNGRATVSLVKGQRLKVFLEGTTFQREFVVPTTDFDILTVASARPDPLSIVTSPPFPIRMS